MTGNCLTRAAFARKGIPVFGRESVDLQTSMTTFIDHTTSMTTLLSPPAGKLVLLGSGLLSHFRDPCVPPSVGRLGPEESIWSSGT